jgi:hypothetical protein
MYLSSVVLSRIVSYEYGYVVYITRFVSSPPPPFVNAFLPSNANFNASRMNKRQRTDAIALQVIPTTKENRKRKGAEAPPQGLRQPAGRKKKDENERCRRLRNSSIAEDRPVGPGYQGLWRRDIWSFEMHTLKFGQIMRTVC